MKTLCALSLFAVACATSHAAPGAASADTGAPPSARVRISGGEMFSPEMGSPAVRAFVPDVAATEDGGECALHKIPNSTALIATATFPNRKEPLMSVSMTFDAQGKVVRYSETRGIPRIKGGTIGMTETQRDSSLGVAIAAVRSTIVMLDYPLDQGILRNRGGGLPEHAAVSSAREVEGLPRLGIKARMEHFRKLCGV